MSGKEKKKKVSLTSKKRKREAESDDEADDCDSYTPAPSAKRAKKESSTRSKDKEAKTQEKKAVHATDAKLMDAGLLELKRSGNEALLDVFLDARPLSSIPAKEQTELVALIKKHQLKYLGQALKGQRALDEIDEVAVDRFKSLVHITSSPHQFVASATSGAKDYSNKFAVDGVVVMPLKELWARNPSALIAEFKATTAAFPEFLASRPETYSYPTGVEIPASSAAGSAGSAGSASTAAGSAGSASSGVSAGSAGSGSGPGSGSGSAGSAGSAAGSAGTGSASPVSSTPVVEIKETKKSKSATAKTKETAKPTKKPRVITTKTAPFQYSGGSFGSMGTPSSIHNEMVRNWRQWITAELMPFFKTFWADHLDHSYNFHCIIDRLMQREVGMTPMADSLHRDLSPASKEGDRIIGGWFNCDDKIQVLRCAPRSHRVWSKESKSFVTPTGAAAKASGFSKFHRGSVEYIKWMNRLQDIAVPQGHVLLFLQEIAHVVLPKKADATVRRLFTAWRFTKDDEPLMPAFELKKCLIEQANVRIKSNQEMDMYPNLWWTNHTARLQAWSQACFQPNFLIDRVMGSGAKKGMVFKVVPSGDAVPSLTHLGTVLKSGVSHRYPDYSEDEIALYFPNQELTLREPGWSTNRTVKLSFL